MTAEAPPFQLHLGDCLEGMAGLADLSVDHVIADPPYDEHTHGNAKSSKGDIPIDFAHVTSTAFLGEIGRISKRWQIVFCALEQLGDYKRVAADQWIRSGLYVRTNGTPQLTGDRPAQAAEGIFIGHRSGRKRWNGGGNRAEWRGPREMNGEHPTQKPLWLMEALVLDFTEPGDLVCDPYMGSGTTGVAAVQLGRRFLGWERDPKYFEIAQRRISAAKEQIRLFPATMPRKAKTEDLFARDPSKSV